MSTHVAPELLAQIQALEAEWDELLRRFREKQLADREVADAEVTKLKSLDDLLRAYGMRGVVPRDGADSITDEMARRLRAVAKLHDDCDACARSVGWPCPTNRALNGEVE